VGASPSIAIGDGILDVLDRKAPKSRFDCPAAEIAAGRGYLVLYASTTELGAFIETFGNRRMVTPAERKDLELGAIGLSRPLKLIDLHSPAIVRLYEQLLDEGVCTIRNYWLTWAWSAALHRCAPDADGLIYRAREAGEAGESVALFSDRARDFLLRDGPSVPVGDVSLADTQRLFVKMTDIKWAK
jgi:hypothetical protein